MNDIEMRIKACQELLVDEYKKLKSETSSVLRDTRQVSIAYIEGKIDAYKTVLSDEK